jgi:hypothetical protein
MKKCLFLFIAIVINVSYAQQDVNNAPLIIVYAEDHYSVQTATISVTNTHEDVAILITSVEFVDQLPETRYFYHGIVGGMGKRGNQYFHNPSMQASSLPVGSCFLLPKQSTSWKRILRVFNDSYETKIKWKEIPKEKINSHIWFETNNSTNVMTILYEPLQKEKETIFCNISAAQGRTPNVIVEGEFKEHELVYHVKSEIKRHTGREVLEGFPDNSYRFNIDKLADSIVVTKEKVIFRKYNMAKKEYEIIDSPDWSPLVMDFLYFRERTVEKTVPSILSPGDFNDLIEVKLPSTDRFMSYNPGITQVPFKLIGEILKRVQERNLDLQLKCIEPYSYGKHLVLTIGVKVDNEGRRV